MKLSTRTRYGVRALLELAEHEGEGPIQLKRIAETQDISVKYLEQLISILKASGLVRSVRGAKGGYLLARESDKIRLSEAFTALEGPVVTAECVDNEHFCERTGDCAARIVWEKVQKAVLEILDSMTLADMMELAKNHNNVNYQI
jgi:Rrf2 family protein